MATLHTIHRCGVVTHVALPRVYNIPENHKDSGLKEKTFRLSSQAKRKIRSSLIRMWHEKQNRLTFWTFTFQLSPETSEVVTNQKTLNRYFSALLENAKKSYGLSSYIWVSERTKKGTIHYHCVFDVPRLERLKKKTAKEIRESGGKVFEHFLAYYKSSFRDLLLSNGVSVSPDVDYCSIGFPDKYDKSGKYRGSVVRSVSALSIYLAGYLQKCSRVETEGRIYAISRNIIERPVSTFDGYLPFAPARTVEKEYCSIDYFYPSSGYDDFFIKAQEEQKTAPITESDIARKELGNCRMWKKKHRKNSVRLNIPEYFYRKVYRNTDRWDFQQWFEGLTESQKIILLTPRQLGDNWHKFWQKKQRGLAEVCQNVIPLTHERNLKSHLHPRDN